MSVTGTTTTEVAPPAGGGGGARGLLRGLGVALAVLLVAGGALNLAGTLARESAQVHRTYTGVRVVDVDVSIESVEVRAGAGDGTRLDRTVSWSLGRPTYTQRQVGDQLVLRSSCPVLSMGRGCGGTVRLVVPAATVVRAHSSAGSVRVTGVAGRLDLDSSAGSVTGDALAAGRVSATSSAGSVHLTFATAPTDVRADSSAGSVEVLLPHGPESYRVTGESMTHAIDASVRTDPSSARHVVATSSAGSVRVGYAG